MPGSEGVLGLAYDVGERRDALVIISLGLAVDVLRGRLVGHAPHQQRRVARGLPHNGRSSLRKVEEPVGDGQDDREPELGAGVQEAQVGVVQRGVPVVQAHRVCARGRDGRKVARPDSAAGLREANIEVRDAGGDVRRRSEPLGVGLQGRVAHSADLDWRAVSHKRATDDREHGGGGFAEGGGAAAAESARVVTLLY
eukprot:scaffold119854_cov69-Phaeocystis_antarctica.AAC.5